MTRVNLTCKMSLLTCRSDMNYGSCNFSNHELLFALKEVRKLNSLLPEEFRGVEVNPGPEVTQVTIMSRQTDTCQFDTDEKLLNFIRSTLWGHHISGSAPMGVCSDVNAVLDNHGRVFGVEGDNLTLMHVIYICICFRLSVRTYTCGSLVKTSS